MNAVQLIGRLTKDPETRYSPNQTAVTRFTLAVNRQGKDKGADFIPIVVFGSTAEVCEKYLNKGRQVGIEGRIQTGSYEKQDGTKVYTTDVIAQRVHFINDGTKGSQKSSEAPREAPQMDAFREIEADVPF
jgi:single-strand DNA-binding protein